MRYFECFLIEQDLKMHVLVDAKHGSYFVHDPKRSLSLMPLVFSSILKTLESCDGNRTGAADTLGISSRTLRNKLHEYGMSGIFKKGGNGVAVELDDE